jgi:hypothetical protein
LTEVKRIEEIKEGRNICSNCRTRRAIRTKWEKNKDGQGDETVSRR